MGSKILRNKLSIWTKREWVFESMAKGLIKILGTQDKGIMVGTTIVTSIKVKVENVMVTSGGKMTTRKTVAFMFH